MGYEIDYSSMTGQAKMEKGIRDIKNYLPRSAFNILATVAMEAIEYRELSFYAGFAGVQGYPVAALWDYTRQEMRDMSE